MAIKVLVTASFVLVDVIGALLFSTGIMFYPGGKSTMYSFENNNVLYRPDRRYVHGILRGKWGVIDANFVF